MKISFTLITILFASMRMFGQAPVALNVHHMPTPVKIGENTVAYYELWLTPATARPLTLQALDVISLPDSTIVATFNAEDLKRRYVIPNVGG